MLGAMGNEKPLHVFCMTGSHIEGFLFLFAHRGVGDSCGAEEKFSPHIAFLYIGIV